MPEIFWRDICCASDVKAMYVYLIPRTMFASRGLEVSRGCSHDPAKRRVLQLRRKPCVVPGFVELHFMGCVECNVYRRQYFPTSLDSLACAIISPGKIAFRFTFFRGPLSALES